MPKPRYRFQQTLIYLNKPSKNVNLQQEYKLLDYAKEFWVDHASSFTEDLTEIWRQFKNLVLERELPFSFRPWVETSPILGKPSNPAASTKGKVQARLLDAFYWGLDKGNGPLVKLVYAALLPYKNLLLDFNHQDYNKHPLCVASRMGHEQILETFLSSMTSVSILNNSFFVPPIPENPFLTLPAPGDPSIELISRAITLAISMGTVQQL